MALHSGNMKLSVPAGSNMTADHIHFEVRPFLARLGIQPRGFTKTFAQGVYIFNIDVQGGTWDDIVRKLTDAQSALLTTYGLQMKSS